MAKAQSETQQSETQMIRQRRRFVVRCTLLGNDHENGSWRHGEVVTEDDLPAGRPDALVQNRAIEEIEPDQVEAAPGEAQS